MESGANQIPVPEAAPGRLRRILPEENTVRVRNVIKNYEMGDNVVQALRGVNFEIKRGEYISIMGASGSGKSTLFNMVGGLDKPTEGRVYIDEVDIAQLDTSELAWLRCRKIGYIFLGGIYHCKSFMQLLQRLSRLFRLLCETLTKALG